MLKWTSKSASAVALGGSHGFRRPIARSPPRQLERLEKVFLCDRPTRYGRAVANAGAVAAKMACFNVKRNDTKEDRVKTILHGAIFSTVPLKILRKSACGDYNHQELLFGWWRWPGTNHRESRADGRSCVCKSCVLYLTNKRLTLGKPKRDEMKRNGTT